MLALDVDSQKNVNDIEKACIHSFQDLCESGILLNKHRKTSPDNLTAEEQSFAEEFVEMIIRERQAWVDSNFGENTEATV